MGSALQFQESIEKTTRMNTFSQFNIKVESQAFEGDKIKMSRILNREIVVHHFKLEDSKVKSFQAATWEAKEGDFFELILFSDCE